MNAKEINKLIEFFEAENFKATHDKKSNTIEFETHTGDGVNMLFTLPNIKKLALCVAHQSFNDEIVENFSVDEEIDLHRQGEDYRKAFTIRESLEDFEAFQLRLEGVGESLNELAAPKPKLKNYRYHTLSYHDDGGEDEKQWYTTIKDAKKECRRLVKEEGYKGAYIYDTKIKKDVYLIGCSPYCSIDPS